MPDTNKTVSLFDKTVEFSYEEVRNYLFWLKPIDPNIKLNNNDSHMLGTLEISWKSYLGDQTNPIDLGEVHSTGLLPASKQTK